MAGEDGDGRLGQPSVTPHSHQKPETLCDSSVSQAEAAYAARCYLGSVRLPLLGHVLSYSPARPTSTLGCVSSGTLLHPNSRRSNPVTHTQMPPPRVDVGVLGF